MDRSSELVVDYRNYDFRSVWQSRQDVDLYDRRLLGLALPSLDSRRTLEIGTGFGRLTPQILGTRGEYVGVDYDLGGLRDTRKASLQAGLPNPRSTWLAANAYHLPFASGSFSSVCMVRVHHHLAEPTVALSEIARVLSPGGTALITYSAMNGLGSLAHDLRVASRRPKVAHDRYLLFARGGHVQVREVPLRQFITTSSRFARDLVSSGLVPERRLGGPETTAARILPLRIGLRLGLAWPAAPFFSTRWVVAQKPGDTRELPPWETLLACPSCGAPGPRLEGGAVNARPCSGCGFPFREDGGLVDARYVPVGGLAASATIRPSEKVSILPFAARSIRRLKPPFWRS